MADVEVAARDADIDPQVDRSKFHGDRDMLEPAEPRNALATIYFARLRIKTWLRKSH